ncbi:S4 domain-containing protein YaaA [Streptococcus cameli]
MEYKLFDEFITLQSLLKTLGLLPSGGAIKSFLADNTVLFNGEKEERRGKKIRIGDLVELPNQGISISIIQPSQEEIEEHQNDLEEKQRVAQLVKQMNKKLKKKASPKQATNKPISDAQKRPVRFPGT